MKNIIKRMLCITLALTICWGFNVPVCASNNRGVVYTAKLDQSKIVSCEEEQTVVMEVHMNKSMAYCSLDYDIVCPKGISVKNYGHENITFTSIQAANNVVSWASDDAMDISSDNIAIITFTIPANLEAGEYTFTLKNITLSDEYGFNVWETGVSVQATLTVVCDETGDTEVDEPDTIPDEPDISDIPDEPDVPDITDPVWTNCSRAWAEPYLRDAVKKDIYPDILLQADMTRAISREEFAAVAVKYYEALTGREAKLNQMAANPFTDVTAQQKDVLIAYQLGVVNGMSATTFAPNSTLTRAQAVTMLGRVVELAELGTITNGSGLKTGGVLKIFSDSHLVASWAANYVHYFVSHGVIDGMGDGTFAPNGNMTREQAMKVAVVALDK